MAESSVRNPEVFEYEGDLFSKLGLEAEHIIESGICRDVVLAISLDTPELRCVVKKFTLLDEDHKERNTRDFRAEVQYMQSFEHPYLINCLVAAQCQDYMAICMQYYPRGSLEAHVGNLSLDLAEQCITQVACALRYLHKHNVAHLDVKLENIFVDEDFNVVLGDFGIAVELPPNCSMVQKSYCGGTPGYHAPEKIGAADEKQLDPYKMDAYCLGIVWWALVTERYPNPNINYYHETRQKRDLPTRIRDLLLRLLERNPTRRARVGEFLRRLRRDSVHRHIIDSN